MSIRLLQHLVVRPLFGLCFALFFSHSAVAHEPFEITTTAKILPDSISLRLLITDSTASKICWGNDSDKRLSAASLQEDQAHWQACAHELFIVEEAGQRRAATALIMSLSPENDWEVSLVYPPSATGQLRFTAQHLLKLDDSSYGATFTATTAERFLVQQLLLAENPTLDIQLEQAPVQTRFSEYVHLGIEHILSGYDHLLFLAGLLLVCRSLRACVLIITAFTLAHSLTLLLAASGAITLASRWAELAIAATIVFVGVENLWLWRRGAAPRWRWQLRFGFGLIHGLGFAGALQASGLSASGWALVPPLFGFNLGVELGQLALALVFLPLLFWLKKWPKLRLLEPLLSCLVLLMGAFWLWQRLL